jgi:hypothetical protein
MVKRAGQTYIRTNHNATTQDNLTKCAIAIPQLEIFHNNYTVVVENPELAEYEKIRQTNITEKDTIILKDDSKRGVKYCRSSKTQEDARQHLKSYKAMIKKAAQKQTIDVNLLGAILIDEYCRMGLNDIKLVEELLISCGRDKTTVGIAQVSIKTATGLVSTGYYTSENGQDLLRTSLRERYPYFKQPEHSINVGAANIRSIIDHWQKRGFDISSQFDCIAYYYSVGNPEKDRRPKNFARSLQIKEEFYPLAQKALIGD